MKIEQFLRVGVFFIIGLFLQGCYSPGTLYKYQYSLESTGNMVFEDSLIKATFIIDRNSIQFGLQNKSSTHFKVVWDDASVVIDGKAFHLAHKGVKLADSEKSQVSRMVPPFSEINESVIPSHNVYYRSPIYTKYYSRPGGWELLDLFPVYDHNKRFMREQITLNKGKKLRLFLPLQMENECKYYDFKFVINNVGPAKFFKE